MNHDQTGTVGEALQRIAEAIESHVNEQKDMAMGLHAIADALEGVANALGIIASTYQLNDPVLPRRPVSGTTHVTKG